MLAMVPILVKHFLENGADVHVEDNDGYTALQTACSYGTLSTVKEFVHAGSDIHKTNTKGRTALHIACGYGQIDIAALLIKPEVKVDEVSVDNNNHVVDKGLDVNKP